MQCLCLIFVVLTSIGQPFFFSALLDQFCEFQQLSTQSFSEELAMYFTILVFVFPFLLFHSRKYDFNKILCYMLFLGGFLLKLLFTVQISYACLFYSILRLIYALLLPCYTEMILLNSYPNEPEKVLKLNSLTYALIPCIVPLLLNCCLNLVSAGVCISCLGCFSMFLGVIAFRFVKIPRLQNISKDRGGATDSPNNKMKIILYASMMAIPYLIIPGYTYFRYAIVESMGCTRDWENIACTYSCILRVGFSFFFAEQLNRFKSFKGLCLSILPLFLGTSCLFLPSKYIGVILFYTGMACTLGILSILKGLIWNSCIPKSSQHASKSVEKFLVALFSNSSIFIFGRLTNTG